MALLFIYDRSQDHFSEMFGVTHEEWIGMHERLFDMVVEDIDLNFNDKENETSIVQRIRTTPNGKNSRSGFHVWKVLVSVWN